MNMQSKPPRTPAEQAIVDAFTNVVSDLPGDAAVTSARDRLLAGFSAQGLPTRRIEAWHYTDLRALLRVLPDGAFGVPQPVSPLVEGAVVLSVVQGASDMPVAIAGVEIEPFLDHLASGAASSGLVARGTDDVIGALNGAFVTDGFSLDVADGVTVEPIIELQVRQAGGRAHTRFPARFGRKAKATVIERQVGRDDLAGFSTSVSALELEDGAEVTWIIVQQKGAKDQHLGQLTAKLGAGSTLSLFIINTGGKLVREELHVSVSGEGAHFNLRGINLLGGDSHTDLTLKLNHDAPGATSSEIVRNVVLDRARGVFQGQIQVAQIAQKTDARMACNTLLLSDEAEWLAKPELEIFADDVVCAHGATVIDIDKTHLFYLMARGITEKSARGLLVNGFVGELIGDLADEALASALEGLVETWLNAHA